MELDDRCEICGRPSQLIEAMFFDGEDWVPVLIHMACENNRRAQMRTAGMAGRN